MSLGLARPVISAGAQGRGVRIALLDTGVNFQHPHVDRPQSQVAVIRAEDALVVRQPDHEGDRVGHGTACAALLLHLAPEVELVSIRVTDARPSTDAPRLARAILAAAELGAEVIAVPLGTPRPSAELEEAVRVVCGQDRVLIAARPGPVVFPAALPGVLGVAHLDGVDVEYREGVWVAEGRARPIPGALGTNFYGPSLAVARLAAALARYGQETGASASDALPGFQKVLSVL